MSSEANFAGATFVTYDRPTGERQSSPNVWKVYAHTSHIGLTFTPESACDPPITRNTNPVESSARPSTILSAVDGSRLLRPRYVQSVAKIGAKTRISNGFTDWNQL